MFADALWRWRQVKVQTETVDMAIEREFLADEAAIATKEYFFSVNQLFSVNRLISVKK